MHKFRVTMVGLVAAVLVTYGCKKDPAPASPEPAAVGVAAPEPTAPEPTAPEPTAPEPTAPEPTAPAAEPVATPAAAESVDHVEVKSLEFGKVLQKAEIRDADAVAKWTAAAGPFVAKDNDVRRRCPDTTVVKFLATSGSEVASLGFCNSGPITASTPLDGAELTVGGKTGLARVANEPALRKLIAAALPPAP